MPRPRKTASPIALEKAKFALYLATLGPNALHVAWKTREQLEALSSRSAEQQGQLSACRDWLDRHKTPTVKAENFTL